MVADGFFQSIIHLFCISSQSSKTNRGSTKMNANIHMATIGYLTFSFVSRKLAFKGFTSALYRSTDTRVSVSPATRSDIPAMCCMVTNLHRMSPSRPLGCVIKSFSKIPGIHHNNVNKSARARLARRKFVVVCMQRSLFTTARIRKFPIIPITTMTAYPGNRTKSSVDNFMSLQS